MDQRRLLVYRNEMKRFWHWIKSKLSEDGADQARRVRVLNELRARQAKEAKLDRNKSKAGPIKRLFK